MSRPVALILFATFVLSGCDTAKPECDTTEIRDAVLQAINDDHRNPLGNFAAEQNTAKPEKPLYQLGQQMVARSTSADKRTLKCSGAISATAGNVKGTKEITYTVQKSADGKVSVSVDPFQF